MVPLWCKLTIESYMNNYYSCTLCLHPKFGISNCFRMLLVYSKFRRQTECFMSRKEERLRLSDRNSILMTQNLSGIRSEALIGQRSSFIVLAIVYE